MERRGLVALGLLGLAGAAWIMSEQTTPDEKRAFLAKFAPIDLEISKAEGLTPGVLSAWLAMESNWGRSGLALSANNLAGVKAGPTWIKEGRPYVTYQTREFEGTPDVQTITSNFRKYGSWLESAQDAIKELRTDFSRGGALDAWKRGDIPGFLSGIAASGYSTAANYGGRIENFMRDIAELA